MAEKRILVIDDQPQDSLWEDIQRALRKECKIDLSYEQINPLHIESIEGGDLPCLKDVESEVDQVLGSDYYSLAAVDYSYGADCSFNGWGIIKHIRKANPKLQIVLYTGERSRVINDIFKAYKNNEFQGVTREIEQLMKSNIAAFLARDTSLKSEIIKLLKQRNFEDLLFTKFEQHRDLKVNAPELHIHEKSLSEIASILQRESAAGRYPEETWLDEIFDQLIAYLSKVYE